MTLLRKSGLKRTAFKKRTKSPLQKMKEKAWKAFSKYIRFRAIENDGLVTCYTCGSRKEWKYMDAGHWKEGHGNAVYINEDFVRPQCKSCNIYHGGRQAEFKERIKVELGEKIVEELEEYAHVPMPMTLSDYEELAKHYTRLYLNLQ